jgi:hypothetical protein
MSYDGLRVGLTGMEGELFTAPWPSPERSAASMPGILPALSQDRRGQASGLASFLHATTPVVFRTANKRGGIWGEFWGVGFS